MLRRLGSRFRSQLALTPLPIAGRWCSKFGAFMHRVWGLSAQLLVDQQGAPSHLHSFNHTPSTTTSSITTTTLFLSAQRSFSSEHLIQNRLHMEIAHSRAPARFRSDRVADSVAINPSGADMSRWHKGGLGRPSWSRYTGKAFNQNIKLLEGVQNSK